MYTHTLHFISNTHWDREWYMSFERFRYRLVRLMDRLLDLLARQPEYRFVLDGQFIPVKDYLEIRPERAAELRHFVAEGRLKIGPWYTQPLETLASGESMLRNLMLGVRLSRQFGGCMPIAYMIDEFGHTSQMPQMLRGFGIQDALVWRGIPPVVDEAASPTTHAQKSVFRWAGSDGSEVHLFYSNGGYGEATALPLQLEDFNETIDGEVFERRGLRNRVAGLLALRTPNATTPHLLCLNGIDHSFAQEELLEVIELINREFPELHARQSTLEEYTAAVKQAHTEANLPYNHLQGELMDSYEPILKDIHSFRAEQKAANRAVEGLLEKWAEPFSAFAWLTGSPSPSALLGQAWEYVLQNHSHDSLGCASADAVYRQVMARYEWAHDLGEEITVQSLQALANRLPAEDDSIRLFVFNPLQWGRSAAVEAALDIPTSLNWESFALLGPNGEVPYHLLSRQDTLTLRYNPRRGHPTNFPITRWRFNFRAEDVPALGYQLYRAVPRSPQVSLPKAGLTRGDGGLENEFLRVVIRPNGFDLLHKPSLMGCSHMGHFEDCGEAGNGYTHEKPLLDQDSIRQAEAVEIRLVEDTPLRAAYEIRQVLRLPVGLNADRTARLEETVACPITTRLALERGSPRLELDITVENHARDHRLRMLFPSDSIHSSHSFAEMPFDIVTRPASPPPPAAEQWELPRPTHPMQSFAGMEDEHSGLLVSTSGLYEYELTAEDPPSLAITLLRCSDRIDAYPFGAMEETRIPLAQCQGTFHFHISLLPYGGNHLAALPQAYASRFPLRAVQQRLPEESVLPGFEADPLHLALPRRTLFERHSFLSVEPQGLLVSAVKQSENACQRLSPLSRGDHPLDANQPHSTSEGMLVVRLWNPGDEPIHGNVKPNLPGVAFQRAWLANLNEEPQSELPLASDGSVEVTAHPRGICTLLFCQNSA